jgi:DHA1 family tetracycline resistance protein-like MFS transporter
MISLWPRWVEPWYMAYALLGATTAGLAPILLPLSASRNGDAIHVGLVMASFNLGGLTAPLWGSLADRNRLHRWLLCGGLLTTAIGLAAFPLTKNQTARLGFALLQGMGATGSATVANLFVVEVHPQSEWDERIGWLQTFYGGGQVGGLFLAGILSQTDLRRGLFVASGLTLMAALLGWLTTQKPPKQSISRRPLLQRVPHSEWVVGSPQHLYHHPSLNTLLQLGKGLQSPFGLFLISWFISFGSSAAFFSLYPVLMGQVFGLSPSLSSSGYAIAAGLGLVFYTIAGGWSDRIGPTVVMQIGLGLRLLAFLGLLFLGLTHFTGSLALIGFFFVVLAWSLLSVSGTALTAKLSPSSEGEGMGIFNAATALSSVIGAACGGWTAAQWGYNGATVLAVGGVGLSLILISIQNFDGDKRRIR